MHFYWNEMSFGCYELCLKGEFTVFKYCDVGTSYCTTSELPCAAESSSPVPQPGNINFHPWFYIDLIQCEFSFYSLLFKEKRGVILVVFYCRSGELSWPQSLQKSGDGLSMQAEGFITVLGTKEVDFVLTQTFLFAYSLPLFD